MGSTPEGRDWCIKALHPSDPLNQVRGIPDESSIPSVFLNYQTVVTVAPPANSTGSWGFDMTVTPHPVSFAELHAYDDTLAHNQLINVLNAQLTGATHPAKYATFKGLAQRWRMAYCGVTCTQDGASMTNQGTIAACQTAVQPLIISGGALRTSTAAQEINVPAGDVYVGFQRMFSWQAGDQPVFANCQSMPNGYVGLSKEGLYMPLRLTRTHQQWHSAHDEGTSCGVNAPSDFGYKALPNGAGATPKYWPFDDPVTGLASPYLNNGTGLIQVGEVTSAMCNDVFGHICAQNLALTTRYTFFFRYGFEVQVQPGTVLSPHQGISPAFDPQATEAYYRLSREMKDAYPEEYNSLGKLWDVISTAAKGIAPFLSFIPTVGPALSMGVNGAAAVGDKIRAYFKGKGKDTQSSMADKKAVSDAVEKAVARRQPPPLPPRDRARDGSRLASSRRLDVRRRQ